MPTIAMTKRYRELNYRHLKLIQLYSVMSELRLHTNIAVNADASKYYLNKLYGWGNYGPFLTVSMESMMQVFYIELDGFIGAYWHQAQNRIHLRKHNQGSLAEYLNDGKRVARKRSARAAFEALLKDDADALALIHELRGKLAHFKKLGERGEAIAPSDIKTREILNKLAEVNYLLGFQKWNQPHYIKQDDISSDSTQKVIDVLVASDHNAKGMREVYMKERNSWFGDREATKDPAMAERLSEEP